MQALRLLHGRIEDNDHEYARGPGLPRPSTPLIFFCFFFIQSSKATAQQQRSRQALLAARRRRALGVCILGHWLACAGCALHAPRCCCRRCGSDAATNKYCSWQGLWSRSWRSRRDHCTGGCCTGTHTLQTGCAQQNDVACPLPDAQHMATGAPGGGAMHGSKRRKR